MSDTLAGLVRSARHELLTFDDPVGASEVPESFRTLAVACTRKTTAQPATVRRIVPRQALAHLPPAGRISGRARVTDSIPFKLVVADRAVAAVPLDLRRHCNGLVLVRDPAVVQALVRTHLAWWAGGVDLETAVSGTAPDHLRPVLDAIMAGMTDETAAARLSMSARTYSRRVGELLAALGTASRFRAGVEAARRGWI
ncbi:DNA-binding response regulator [Streptomyces sp. NPDC059176]|uniref:DNA-binding response regulator n=1 Tax=unclassified Streptomyces TaxID=2593676 RepID=UPI003682EE05